MHRGGALFVTFARNLSVSNVHFTRLGGNAVLLSDAVRNASFESSEFSWWIGDNGILQMGGKRKFWGKFWGKGKFWSGSTAPTT